MAGLPLWVEAVLHEMGKFAASGHGLASPIGAQLARAELFAKHLADCRRCRGRGYREKSVEVPNESDRVWLATHGLPAVEELPCGYCKQTGKVWRTRHSDSHPDQGFPWPYMYVRPEATSEPSYQMLEPPALGKNGKLVRNCLQDLPALDRAILLDYYTDFPRKPPTTTTEAAQERLRNLLPL